MPLRFPLALRVLHWLIAFFIVAMLFLGVAIVSISGKPYPELLLLHRTFGIAILLLASTRLAIRMATATPPMPDDLPAAQIFAARASHVLLYLAMIGMPLIGWAMLSAGGYPVKITAGLTLSPILPQNGAMFGYLRLGHTAIAFAFFVLILGHLTMGLVHGFIRRDGMLFAMGFGKRPASNIQTVVAPTQD